LHKGSADSNILVTSAVHAHTLSMCSNVSYHVGMISM